MADRFFSLLQPELGQLLPEGLPADLQDLCRPLLLPADAPEDLLEVAPLGLPYGVHEGLGMNSGLTGRHETPFQRNVARGEHRVLGQSDCSLDDRPQFPDIAWPMVGQKLTAGLGSDASDVF